MKNDKLAPKITAFRKELLKNAQTSLFIATKRAVKEARLNHYYKNKKGLLRRATKMKRVSQFSYIVFIDDAIAPYGKYQHEGTKDHTVMPKRTKALRFRPKGQRTWWYSKGHDVKGIKADPFVKKAVENQKGFLKNRLIRILKLSFARNM